MTSWVASGKEKQLTFSVHAPVHGQNATQSKIVHFKFRSAADCTWAASGYEKTKAGSHMSLLLPIEPSRLPSCTVQPWRCTLCNCPPFLPGRKAYLRNVTSLAVVASKELLQP